MMGPAMRNILIMTAFLFVGCRSDSGGGFFTRLHLTDWVDSDSNEPTYQDVVDQRNEYLRNVQNGTIPVKYPDKK